eukprot:c18491_g1_i1.p1 GENE.c18491_g1_i1~~c18491_g1_i1.p1  ORF type:complete len:345 (-),score=100.92 c18491_g1_i1:53-1087(-)
MENFVKLSREYQDLYGLKEVDRISAPTAIEFLRDYVSINKPVVIQGALENWKASSKWHSSQYLNEKLGEKTITIEMTPNGFGDAIVNNENFVMPTSEKVKFNEFMTHLNQLELSKNDSDQKSVWYISHQNSNLTSEFDELISDIELDIPFATDAFGCNPDAVNIWIGETRAITSLHKDHYENMYAVICGEKKFILYPPIDFPFLYERKYRKSMYEIIPQKNGEIDYQSLKASDFKIQTTDEFVPWLSVDPLHPDYEKYPWFQYASPIEIIVKEGEILYLPSLFFHHVSQTQPSPSHPVIAVNFWYDMKFDIKYCYYQFLTNLRLTNFEEFPEFKKIENSDSDSE